MQFLVGGGTRTGAIIAPAGTRLPPPSPAAHFLGHRLRRNCDRDALRIGAENRDGDLLAPQWRSSRITSDIASSAVLTRLRSGASKC